jgi:hypothetical protein
MRRAGDGPLALALGWRKRLLARWRRRSGRRCIGKVFADEQAAGQIAEWR